MVESAQTQDWFRLDNAAKIYPPAYSDLAPEVFRVGLTLTEPVRLADMETALERTVRRCPYYQVHLKRGLFWYYLQRHRKLPRIELLESPAVSRIRMRADEEQLFRVFVRERVVRIDFSHVLTDGFGAFRFLSTLVAEYLRQRGVEVPCGPLVMDPDQPPHPEESVDAYPELYRPGTPKPEPLTPAYHLPGTVRSGYHRIIAGTAAADMVVDAARRFRVSLTELLASIYIHSILQIRNEAKPRSRGRRIIRLEVPADMRRIHRSQTMRNFSLFVTPGIDLRLGDFSFEDIVRTVHHTMRLQLDPRELRRQIARNVGGERLLVVRLIPLLIKDLYLSSLHHRLGGNLASGVISNLGNIVFPEEMARHVTDVAFLLGPNPTLKKAVSLVSYRGKLNIAIGSVIESRELERRFFKTLVELGVSVRVVEKSA